MLLSTLILQICAGLSGQELTACHKALEAASRQTGIEQNLNQAEKTTSDFVYKKAASITGEEVLGAAGVTYRIVKDKSITFPLRKRPDGFIPSVTPTIGIDSGSLNLGWKF